MNIISHPTERTYWIIFQDENTALGAGYTDSDEVTESKWELRIYPTENQWEEECIRLGLEIPPLDE